MQHGLFDAKRMCRWLVRTNLVGLFKHKIPGTQHARLIPAAFLNDL